MRHHLPIVAIAAVGLLAGAAQASAHGRHHDGATGATSSIFAQGFNNPRGLTFGPDGNLYVAEGGLGGSNKTVGQCDQAHGAAAPYTGSTGDPVLGGRISMVTPSGHVSTVVDSLPSSQTSPALGSLVSGVSSVAFVHHRLYGLLAGAGCSHGVPDVPNGVFRVGSSDSWSLIANLSAFQQANPVVAPDDEDFEPDGTWYSMAAFRGALYPMDSNHGELDRVSTGGSISRVVDISAEVGHVVPTAITRSYGNWTIGNLGVFGAEDGTTPNEHLYRIGHHGHITVRTSGLEQVVGLAHVRHDLYALELAATPGGPTPATGAIVRVRGNHLKTVFSGLTFPTGMTAGPDGALYVSVNGLGFPAGQGMVVRVDLGHHHHD